MRAARSSSGSTTSSQQQQDGAFGASQLPSPPDVTPGAATAAVDEARAGAGEAAPPAEKRSRADAWAYLWRRLGEDLGKYIASPRRDFTYWAILGVSLLATIASDIFGVMQALLSLDPQLARQVRLDEVYPVGGLKSFRREGKYCLRYPATWLFDQSVAFSKQADFEGRLSPLKKRKAIVPDAAFGPPGGGIAPSSVAENLSVVEQAIPMIDRLEDSLGDPRQAFQRLFVDALAPGSSGRSVELLVARTRDTTAAVIAGRSRGDAIEFEYILTKPPPDGGPPAVFHSWSVAALGSPSSARASTRPLYTMTVVAPEASLTDQRRRMFAESWQSFTLQS